jgi:hypothetical protein
VDGFAFYDHISHFMPTTAELNVNTLSINNFWCPILVAISAKTTDPRCPEVVLLRPAFCLSACCAGLSSGGGAFWIDRFGTCKAGTPYRLFNLDWVEAAKRLGGWIKSAKKSTILLHKHSRLAAQKDHPADMLVLISNSRSIDFRKFCSIKSYRS